MINRYKGTASKVSVRQLPVASVFQLVSGRHLTAFNFWFDDMQYFGELPFLLELRVGDEVEAAGRWNGRAVEVFALRNLTRNQDAIPKSTGPFLAAIFGILVTAFLGVLNVGLYRAGMYELMLVTGFGFFAVGALALNECMNRIRILESKRVLTITD